MTFTYQVIRVMGNADIQQNAKFVFRKDVKSITKQLKDNKYRVIKLHENM